MFSRFAWKAADISGLVGKTLVSATAHDDMVFITDNGEKWVFYHEQDCCEDVYIQDVCGDLNWLVGSPLLQAEEVDNDEPEGYKHRDSYTWTFYKFATINGYVTVRWLGESNGYYSERVSLRMEKIN